MAKEKTEKNAGFEEQFEKLEECVKTMENPDTSLEDSFESYKAGMALVRSLNGMIDRMEKEVEILAAKEEET